MAEIVDIRWERAIAGLLSQRTIADAAKVSGVPSRTLSRWLTNPEFVSALRKARQEVASHVTARLQVVSADAVATLGNLINDATCPPMVRVVACRTALEFALRSTEHELLEDRVRALEETAEMFESERVSREEKWGTG